MSKELNKDWKQFKKELHAAIKENGAGNIDIVRNKKCIYAVCKSGTESVPVTRYYVPDMLSASEVQHWKITLELYKNADA